MKRPVIAILWILALLAGGLYLAFFYKDQPAEEVKNCYEGAAARTAIQAYLELALPPTASDVHCCVEDVERTKFAFARFDISSVELPSLLGDQARFPAVGDLKRDPAMLSAMATLSDPKRPWWQIEKLKGAVCGQKSGRRNVAPATVKWRVQICMADVSATTTTVYVAFAEEAAAAEK